MKWSWILLFATTGTAQQTPSVHYLQLPDGHAGHVRDVVFEDFDGDGRPDLIVSTGASSEDDNGTATPPRTLRVHLRREGRPAFSARPDRELALARNVVAFAIGDVHPNPGAEIVLFAPTVAAAAFWHGDSEEPTYDRLARIRFLWQPADPRYAFAWPRAVGDLDGDGLDDLLIPEPDGYRVVMQRRETDADPRFDDGVLLRLPPTPPDDRTQSSARLDTIELKFGDGERSENSSLVEVDDGVPAPQVIDQDGDGHLDVCAMADERLHVWTQGPASAFSAAPTATYALPKRKQSFVNVSYSAQLRDLDADGRADVIVVSSQSVDDEVRSTIEIYLGGDARGPFSGGDKATDRLRIRGFVNVPTLDDVDGDGRPDLAIGSVRPNLISNLATGGDAGGRVEAQLNLFRNALDAGQGRFKRPVWLVHKVTIEDLGGDDQAETLARFFRDVDGDGHRDLLLRSDRETVQVLQTTVRGRGLAVGNVLWKLRIDANAPLQVVESGGVSGLLVRESRQVIYVEFR